MDIHNLIDKVNENDSTITKKIKVFHSSFSNNKVFNPENTFTVFDMEKYGAFHGACEIEGSDAGRKVAENRVFVKILEDAHKMVGVSPHITQQVLNDTADRVDFQKLEELTGYKVKGQFENPIMLEAEVSYKRAITLNENRTGQWLPYDIIREVMTKYENGEDVHGITEEDLDDYYNDEININGRMLVDLCHEDYGGEEFNQDYKEFMFVRDWLESKGYDAIKYQNTFEGNSECIMSLRPENVKITNSYCLKHLLEDTNPKEKSKNRKKLKM